MLSGEGLRELDFEAVTDLLGEAAGEVSLAAGCGFCCEDGPLSKLP